MIHAGADMGLSGPGLKKLCLKHEIPVPSQGWWNKLAAGHTLKRPALPKASSALLDEIEFKTRPAIFDRASTTSGDILGDAIVPTARPDHIPVWIRKAENALRSRKPDHRGLLQLSKKSWPTVSIGPQSIGRLVLFLVGFDLAITRAGWKLKPSDEGLQVIVEDEPVAFSIEDRLTRKPHQPTRTELQEQERRRRYRFLYLNDQPWPKYDYSPSGEIAFVVQGSVNEGLRRKWGDTKRHKLEQTLSSILRSFSEHASAQIAKREYWAEQKRNWAEAERVRREKAEEVRLDKKRFELAECADEVLSKVAALDRVIAHIETQPDATTKITEYLAWCRDYRARLIRSIESEALSERLCSYEYQSNSS